MRRGTRVGQAYVAITADASDLNEEIVDAVEDAGPGVEKAGKDHGEKYGDEFSEGFISRMRSKFTDRLSSSLGSKAAAGRAGDDAGQTFVDRLSDKVSDLGDKIGAELGDRMASKPEQIRRGIDRAFDDEFADRIGERAGARIVKSMADEMEREGSKLGEVVEKLLAGSVSGNGRGRAEASIGDRIGKMFGAGSRNNALNLMGRTVGNLSGLIFKVTGAATSMFGVFAKGFKQVESGSKLLGGFSALGAGAGGGLAKAFTSLAASGPAVIAVIIAVTAAATILVSVLSAALALVVALASTIASALVGALAVGAGAFAALGVAAGLATLAFTSMTDKQRAAAQKTFEPIHAMAAGLGQIMMRQIIPAFETWSKNLQTALALVKPLADVMGGAFARAGTILTAALSGPGIQMFIDALGKTLPKIVTNLSKAFGDFLNGVSGVFAALMPFVLKFSGYLADVANDFAKWATSAKGQNSITDFVTRALESLSALWDFIKEVGGLIRDVLFDENGQKAGNSIFESMTKGVKDLADYLGKEDRLENWFKDGEKFAKGLGDTIETVSTIIKNLNNSKVIDVFADLASFAETAVTAIDKIPGSVSGVIQSFVPFIGQLQTAWDLINLIKNAKIPTLVPTQREPTPEGTSSFMDAAQGGDLPDKLDRGFSPRTQALARGFKNSRRRFEDVVDDIIKSGTKALNQTSESNGGHKPDPVSGNGTPNPQDGSNVGAPNGGKKGYKLPERLRKMANTILAQARTLADDIRAAGKTANLELTRAISDVTTSLNALLTESGNTFSEGLRDAVASTSALDITNSFASVIESMSVSAKAAVESARDDAQSAIESAKSTREQMIASATSAVESAAQRLKSSSSKKETKAALAELKQAKADLALAQSTGDQLVADAQAASETMLSDAKATRDRIERASAILAAQAVTSQDRINSLVAGVLDTNSTLADYAEARSIVAGKLELANEQLANAIAMRDDYNTSVSDAVKSFGSLMSAQAKTLNGVQQALTAVDITDNLRDRLSKIKKFQENLRILLAQGLSDSAYKQLVDAGVESGGAFAQAIADGTAGTVGEINDLTGQIDAVAGALGTTASSHLYQAGVDAAQGLVDGLLSLSSQLDSAAAQLGTAIADAIKRELGIASPSKVMHGLMYEDVGDGMVGGLDAAGNKVGTAASRLAARVAVSPEVAQYTAKVEADRTAAERAASVSGNGDTGPKWLWTGDIVTPTEDPEAVANEVLNELTGRLP